MEIVLAKDYFKSGFESKLTGGSLQEIISIRGSMNKGLTNEFKAAFLYP